MRPDPTIEGAPAAPVLVVSSRAGLGNYNAGAELARRIAATHPVEHVAVEQLASPRRVRAEFDRHRQICLRAPWLLHLVHDLPLSYRWKRFREATWAGVDALHLEARVRETGARTVIAVNSRAALWLGALRRRGRLGAGLRAFVTDYALGASWRYQLWSEVERLYGPVPHDEIPPEVRSRYRQVPMPVREAYRRLAARPGAVNRVALCGGGWGLGGLGAVSEALARALPGVRQEVVCGDNGALFTELQRIAARHPNVRAHALVEHLEHVLEGCASIITKPGGLTLAEASAAGRQIFLLDGLPGVERKNAAFAARVMGATPYSRRAFASWVSARRANGGRWDDA